MMIFNIIYLNGIFRTRLEGEPDTLSLASYYKSLTSHREWNDFARILADETSIDYDRIKTNEMIKLVTTSLSFKNEIKKSSFAIYVNSNLNYGMARMWKAYTDLEWEAQTGVFRSYKDALSWLTKI